VKNDDDLSPEQLVMRALVARVYGDEIADRVVRDDRVSAYLFGSHVKPLIDELIAKTQVMVEVWKGLAAQVEADDDEASA